MHRKSGSVHAQWTLAIAPIGDAAQWIIVLMPYREPHFLGDLLGFYQARRKSACFGMDDSDAFPQERR